MPKPQTKIRKNKAPQPIDAPETEPASVDGAVVSRMMGRYVPTCPECDGRAICLQQSAVQRIYRCQQCNNIWKEARHGDV